jgi:hypothetical protein
MFVFRGHIETMEADFFLFRFECLDEGLFETALACESGPKRAEMEKARVEIACHCPFNTIPQK